MGANAIAGALVSDTTQDDPEVVLKQIKIQRALSLASPLILYVDATATIIDPMRKTTRTIIQMGMLEQLSMARFAGPLSLSQSFFVVLPYIVSLLAITIVSFAMSYLIFMRQEIRSI